MPYENWSTRTLQGRLDSMLFERTALSRKPDELLTSELAALREQGELSPNLVLKDPYKKREQIELLELDQTGIHVAEYLTGLPSRQLLEQKLSWPQSQW